ncbi:hypothetical protein [Streptomyces spiramyceticus]|uniref:hypothetical protein n=1 Tax=Streptomyces spiramyceticus TaxID=299717 RepID=UPI00237A2FDE|nr:hypothetical protein [Streptomyces spiramyceticus]
MRVRVRFRYRADTGEVELYEVEDIGPGPRAADHDARHDRAAAALARIVEDNALIEEVHGDTRRRRREPNESVPEERPTTRRELRDRE